MAADLIDEYLLMIHPLVLGSGRRLFPDNQYTQLRLTEAVTTTTGVVIASYESLASRPSRALKTARLGPIDPARRSEGRQMTREDRPR